MKETEVIDMVPVIVAGKKVMVPKNLKPGDLKTIANIPANRSLVIKRGETRKLIKDSNRITVQEGDHFSDIPDYTVQEGNHFSDIPNYPVSSEEERILLEILLLNHVFDEIEYDSDNFLWVCIHDFRLPEGFNKDGGELLIELPPNYPFSPPKNCFLDRTVRTSGGKEIREHYYPNESYNKYYEKGWAWFCFHITSWKAKEDVMESDNLLTFVDLAHLALAELARENR